MYGHRSSLFGDAGAHEERRFSPKKKKYTQNGDAYLTGEQSMENDVNGLRN